MTTYSKGYIALERYVSIQDQVGWVEPYLLGYTGR